LVRIDGAAPVWVGAGGSWHREVPLVARRHSIAAPLASASASKRSEQSTSDDYAADVALLQEGDYDAAASAFAAFLTAHPNASQAEDASFLEAATLARAGRPDAAALAAQHHLAAYPRSFHRKEAAILVARAARDRGDCSSARAVLAPWLGTPQDAEATAALRSCAAE
jgi:TolA-binding protein